MSRPVIGLTLDSEQPGGYSAMPWYALRENYSRAVARAGGLPILLPHEQPNPRTEPGHVVKVTPGTLLHRICGAAEIAVNSTHHQAVKAVGDGVAVNARAPDGVIEGIEVAERRFCLGVQWHPEYSIGAGDDRIFDAFIAACR